MRRFSKLARASLAFLLALFTALPMIAGQRRVSLPSGTEVKVRLDKQLDTGTAKAGETFTGTLSEAIAVNGRSVFPRGARIGAGDVAVLRTEKTLRPGITPEFLHLVVGAVARRAIPPGEGVEWADIV